jgi:hypothetical protein
VKLSDIPTKFPIPFANSAGPSFIRPIPVSSQIGIQDGAWSLTDGSPPLNFTAKGIGGVPPFGQDANGLFKQITQWARWQGAGGAVPWDSAFSAAIGGYPQNAVVASATVVGRFWKSTVDDNVTNPDSGGAGWIDAFGKSTRVVTSSATLNLDSGTDYAIGLNRTSGLAPMTINLAFTAAPINGQEYEIADLVGNLRAPNTATVVPSAGTTIGGRTAYVMNEDWMVARFRFYAAAASWSVAAA